jgi:hypothetical protein
MRKRTVRRVYDLINPIPHAMYQASTLTQEEWNRQITPVQVAVDQLTRGEWNRDNWQPLIECLNRIESLLKLNNVDASEFIDEAQQAMVNALDRQQETGAKAFRATELATIREIVKVYGDLLKEASHAQFSRACQHTNANVTRILSNKAKMHQTGTVIFERKAA